MIDKNDLLRWVNWLEKQIDYTNHTEDTKKLHRGYCDVFRQHVIDMPEVNPKNNWRLDYYVGFITGMMCLLIGLMVWGKL